MPIGGDTVTRRAGGVKRDSVASSGASPASGTPRSSDAMEKGKFARNGSRWQRPRTSHGNSVIKRLKRDMWMHFKRKPRATQQLYIVVALIGSVVSIFVIFVLFYQKLVKHNPDPSMDVLKAKAKGIHEAIKNSHKIGAAYNMVVNRRTERVSDQQQPYHPQHRKNSIRRKNEEKLISVMIHSFGDDGSNSMRMPSEMGVSGHALGRVKDLGGLDIYFMVEEGSRRNIYLEPREYGNSLRLPEHERDDDMDAYYAWDDDIERADYLKYAEVHQEVANCRRIAEHQLSFPNCNNVHEVDRIESEARYLASGSYREVLSVKHPFMDEIERTIMKQLSYHHDIEIGTAEFVRMDAIVAERLTSHPLIFDMYGFCGLTLLSEFFPHGDLEELSAPDASESDDENDHNQTKVVSYNAFSSEEKLYAALAMAEGIAVLHGYENGVIIHDDIQLSQFLYNEDMTILKLNDFNRAEFMLWDDEGQRYCKYKNGRGSGTWRAPQEYRDEPLDEKIDVFSYCNNVFTVLTGMYPFHYELDTDAEVKEHVKGGIMPKVDERWKGEGIIEAGLVAVMERCFIEDPEERASIFEIVKLLRNVEHEWRISQDQHAHQDKE